MTSSAILLLLLLSGNAFADGFRCGTRLVLEGDPVSRLSKACGQPEYRHKATLDVQKDGRFRSVSVSQWVYQRRGKKPMIVSVRDGQVIRIERG